MRWQVSVRVFNPDGCIWALYDSFVRACSVHSDVEGLSTRPAVMRAHETLASAALKVSRVQRMTVQGAQRRRGPEHAA
jgi:hypothetical protein